MFARTHVSQERVSRRVFSFSFCIFFSRAATFTVEEKGVLMPPYFPFIPLLLPFSLSLLLFFRVCVCVDKTHTFPSFDVSERQDFPHTRDFPARHPDEQETRFDDLISCLSL